MKKEKIIIEERPKLNIAANIVNNLFLDSDYRGKDWEAVRKQLIKDIEQALSQQKQEFKRVVEEIEKDALGIGLTEQGRQIINRLRKAIEEL